MARIYDNAYFGDALVPVGDAQLSVASSAVLYGLSVYTVFPICISASGARVAFRLKDHYRRLVNSARIIGIDTFEGAWPEERFMGVVKMLAESNKPSEDVFIRATVHVSEILPGARSRGLKSTLSAFMYEGVAILPTGGSRLKTSVWRRTADNAIPSRAKVNGAYVNSVLAKQDALDSGYDDAIILDANGHVCELSAANIFIVRDGTLITPDVASDILEGINRATILELASAMDIKALERSVDMTELYIADEVFACGTSAYLAPVLSIDTRTVANGAIGPLTARIKERYMNVLHGNDETFKSLLTTVG